MKKPFLIPLLLMAAAFMLVSARPASAATLDTPWYGSGPGTLSLGESQFGYTANANTHSGAWTYTAVAASSRVTGIKWQYTGYHAWFQVSVKLERFVQRGGTEVFSETLVDQGPVNCCAAPSGGFSYSGTSKFDLREGDLYGFRMSGSNQDSDSTLRGSLSLTAVDVTPPKISAAVIGNKGPNGYYTGPTTVRWTVTDEESAITERVRCDDTPVTTDTHGRRTSATPRPKAAGPRGAWSSSVTRRRPRSRFRRAPSPRRPAGRRVPCP